MASFPRTALAAALLMVGSIATDSTSSPVHAGLAASSTATAATVPDMLERSLPAVMTIGVFKSAPVPTAYGFTTNASDVAYARGLNLGDAESSGSGFIISHQGKKYIVTNAHVVNDASDAGDALAAFSIDRTRYPVRIVGADTFYDIAVLEFTDKEPGEELSVLEFRQELPRLGETVFAIGNPLGEFPYTVTQGIIGGKNRVRDGVTGKFGYLQSSATTIWGNSGGPLVDSQGRVVGINSQIEIAVRQGKQFVQPQLNFALEGPLAQRLVSDIINQGLVSRAFLGLYLAQGDGDAAPRIAGLLPGSPAANAANGKLGYLVRGINGVTVRNLEEAQGELEKLPPGGTVSLELEENKERRVLTFTSGELTQKRHADLATFLLQRYGGLELVRSPTGVALQQAAACGQVGEPCGGDTGGYRLFVADYDGKLKSVDGDHELAELNAAFIIKSAGLVIDLENDKLQVWRVNNPANLGLLMRLHLPMGGLSLLGKLDDEQTLLLLCLVKGDSPARLLLY